MKDFFVSYNRTDRTWAEWVAWQLEAEGYTVILQSWDFLPGSSFVKEMDRATVESQRTLAILSPDYLESEYASEEWGAVLAADPTGRKRALIPVRIREFEVPGLLRTRTYIDLVGLDEAAAKEALLAGVRGERAKPLLPPPFPVGESPAFPGSPPDRRDAVSPEQGGDQIRPKIWHQLPGWLPYLEGRKKDRRLIRYLLVILLALSILFLCGGGMVLAARIPQDSQDQHGGAGLLPTGTAMFLALVGLCGVSMSSLFLRKELMCDDTVNFLSIAVRQRDEAAVCMAIENLACFGKLKELLPDAK